MISLLVALANSQGLVAGAVNYNTWNNSLNQSGTRGGMWLYAYENVGLGINPSTDTTFLENDPYFGLLQNKKVRFLDIDNGLTSLTDTVRHLRGDNSRISKFREDFFADFTASDDEIDDDDIDFDDDNDLY